MKILFVSTDFYKSHVAAYTKKDGTLVAAHDDKRHAAPKKPAKGHSYRLFETDTGNTSHDPWTDEQWSKLRLMDGNTNAATHHRLLNEMRAKAAAGDIDGLKNMAHGVNTYGKKRAVIAKHLVGAMEAAKPAKMLVSKEEDASNLMHDADSNNQPEKKMQSNIEIGGGKITENAAPAAATVITIHNATTNEEIDACLAKFAAHDKNWRLLCLGKDDGFKLPAGMGPGVRGGKKWVSESGEVRFYFTSGSGGDVYFSPSAGTFVIPSKTYFYRPEKALGELRKELQTTITKFINLTTAAKAPAKVGDTATTPQKDVSVAPEMKDGQVSYTFANIDAIPAPFRGKTFTGGKLENHLIGGKLVEVFAFKEKVDGKSVNARVAGKPELEAAASEIKAAAAKAKADARKNLEAAVPGLTQYEAAMQRWSKAQAEYEKASEYGYPGKAAAAASSADDELNTVMAQYPATAMWRKINEYVQAGNHSKSSAGDTAKAAVMSGVPIAEAVKKMEADWNGAAYSAMMNS